MIQTVLGQIDAAKLGITMAHEHLSVNLGSVRGDTDSIFSYSKDLLQELKTLTDAGVHTVVEVSCNDMGRDVQALRKISQESGLQIVFSTGFYLEKYHPAWIKDASIEDIEEIFVKDLTVGIDGTNIKAGIIGEIAGEEKRITSSEEKVMRAAARAASKTGCAVTTHCQLGQMAPAQADLLLSEGMKPEKLILGHLDLANDLDYYHTVLAYGVTMGFDTCGKTAYLADEARIKNLIKLIEEGFSSQIVLSTDISRKSYMSVYGGLGYARVMNYIVPQLKEHGVSTDDIDNLLSRNLARILDMAKD